MTIIRPVITKPKNHSFFLVGEKITFEEVPVIGFYHAHGVAYPVTSLECEFCGLEVGRVECGGGNVTGNFIHDKSFDLGQEQLEGGFSLEHSACADKHYNDLLQYNRMQDAVAFCAMEDHRKVGAHEVGSLGNAPVILEDGGTACEYHMRDIPMTSPGMWAYAGLVARRA